MVPKRPLLNERLGFLYCPPWRIQGVSVAGEQTVVQIPELDVVFDIGGCPRIALSSPTIALSHGHMDHVGGLPYWFSQRVFQKMGTGTCICPRPLEEPLRAMMSSWVGIEGQVTPHRIVGIDHLGEYTLKPNTRLRAIEMHHASVAMGYAVLEIRTKLRPEFVGMPQEAIRELKAKGTSITHDLEIPLVAFTGDTETCANLYRDEFCNARVVLTECTFFDEDHRERAKVGRHLHVEDLPALLEAWQARDVVLLHVSRRSSLDHVRDRLDAVLSQEDRQRVHLLMDHRMNRQRYEEQVDAVTKVDSQPVDGVSVEP